MMAWVMMRVEYNLELPLLPVDGDLELVLDALQSQLVLLHQDADRIAHS